MKTQTLQFDISEKDVLIEALILIESRYDNDGDMFTERKAYSRANECYDRRDHAIEMLNRIEPNLCEY